MQLQQLGTDYVDLYMLHTLPQDPAQLRSVWSIMEQLFAQGRARALGVSNVDLRELRDLLSFAQVRPAYIQNLFKVYKPGEQMGMDEDLVGFAHTNHISVMGYSVQTEWPHVMPPLQDPHIAYVASAIGRTPSQVLHRWALQRGVGVIPKASSYERIAENAKLFDFELSEAAMRLLDGLATLSESGAADTRPPFQEDVYQLGAMSVSSQTPLAGPSAQQAQAPAEPAASGEAAALLTQTRDQGFAFSSIQASLLGPAVNLDPASCHQRCASELSCAAWEVCAPFNPQGGCGGCYLIGQAPATTISIPGWHAAIIRQ